MTTKKAVRKTTKKTATKSQGQAKNEKVVHLSLPAEISEAMERLCAARGISTKEYVEGLMRDDAMETATVKAQEVTAEFLKRHGEDIGGGILAGDDGRELNRADFYRFNGKNWIVWQHTNGISEITEHEMLVWLIKLSTQEPLTSICLAQVEKDAAPALRGDWVDSLVLTKPGCLTKTVALTLRPDEWMVVAEGAAWNKLTLGEALEVMMDREMDFFVNWYNDRFAVEE